MIAFVFNSILLGVGLAMDAFSVSIANGLNEPGMKRSRECLIAGVYAFFQCLMPIIGWFCVHELVRQFRAFEPFIPWIALLLLLWIGGKMLLEGIRDAKAGAPGKEPAAETEAAAGADHAADAKPAADAETAEAEHPKAAAGAESAGSDRTESASAAPDPAVRLTAGTLLLQGIATSIDALSVGFAIAGYSAAAALAAALIIAAVTFLICMGGLTAGKKLGMKLAGKAGILGGCILIFIGIEILVRGVFL